MGRPAIQAQRSTPPPGDGTEPLRIRLSTCCPTRPGLYLYHPPIVGAGDPMAGGYSDRRTQLVPVERVGSALIAIIKTLDDRSLTSPIAIDVRHLVGVWSANLLPTIVDPDMPGLYRSEDL